MAVSASVWTVVLLALVAANLPFMSNRLMGVVRLQHGKTLPMRLLELVLWYFVVGAIGLYLEQRMGQIARQGWEFYAVTGTLFITLAFPGFVYRYLLGR